MARLSELSIPQAIAGFLVIFLKNLDKLLEEHLWLSLQDQVSMIFNFSMIFSSLIPIVLFCSH